MTHYTHPITEDMIRRELRRLGVDEPIKTSYICALDATVLKVGGKEYVIPQNDLHRSLDDFEAMWARKIAAAG